MRIPRFSLRTLFALIALISIPLSWLGFQVHKVHERKKWLSQIEAGGGYAYMTDELRAQYPVLSADLRQEVSWIGRLLGDRPVASIIFVVSDPKDMAKRRSELAPIKAAFPEASVTAGVTEPAFRDQPQTAGPKTPLYLAIPLE